jgi:hypothetical protein
MVKAMKMVLKVARTTSNWLKEFLVFCLKKEHNSYKQFTSKNRDNRRYTEQLDSFNLFAVSTDSLFFSGV